MVTNYAGVFFCLMCFAIGSAAALSEAWLARRRGRKMLSNAVGQNFRLEEHQHVIDGERSHIVVRPNGTVVARCAVYGCQYEEEIAKQDTFIGGIVRERPRR